MAAAQQAKGREREEERRRLGSWAGLDEALQFTGRVWAFLRVRWDIILNRNMTRPDLRYHWVTWAAERRTDFKRLKSGGRPLHRVPRLSRERMHLGLEWWQWTDA